MCVTIRDFYAQPKCLKKRRRGWTPGRLGTDGSRTDSSILTMKAHFLIIFFSFLFNFLSIPFSNLGFLILLSWLPQGALPCPRVYGPREWRGALGVLKILLGFGGIWEEIPSKKPNLLYIYHYYYYEIWRPKKLDIIQNPPKHEICSNFMKVIPLQQNFRKPQIIKKSL